MMSLSALASSGETPVMIASTTDPPLASLIPLPSKLYAELSWSGAALVDKPATI
jgi:hypothetical protein